MTRSTRSFPAAFALTLLALAPTPTAAVPFVRGDFNDDSHLDIADPVSVLDYLFLGGDSAGCLDAGDANDDGAVDIADALSTLGYLFLGAAAPRAPFPDCGRDPTADALSCETRSSCAVPNIADAVGHCGGIPGGEYPNSLQPGDDLHKVTLDAPHAVCNDGTPGAFYVRPADPESPDIDRWAIYLQGGGGCGGFGDCLERWCGRQAAPYNEAKMSSLYTPESIGGTGLFRRRDEVENRFGTWNHVFVYYCSSDSWSGRASDVVLTNPENPDQQYSLHFRGHDIIRATVARLLAGGLRSDDGRVEMPALEDAELVIVAGFSAGSSGVATNGDWIASQLTPNGTVVRLVRDSAFSPPPEYHSDPSEAARVAELHEESSTLSWTRRVTLYDAFVDESAYDALAGSDDEWRLGDSTYIALNHTTAPLFVRTDLGDRKTRERFAEWGVPAVELAAMTAAALLDVPRISELGVEGASIDVPGGSFGTTCGDHAGLMSDAPFFTRTVEDPSGEPRSFHDVLSAWIRGNTVTLVDDPDNRTTACGAPVEENE